MNNPTVDKWITWQRWIAIAVALVALPAGGRWLYHADDYSYLSARVVKKVDGRTLIVQGQEISWPGYRKCVVSDLTAEEARVGGQVYVQLYQCEKVE